MNSGPDRRPPVAAPPQASPPPPEPPSSRWWDTSRSGRRGSRTSMRGCGPWWRRPTPSAVPSSRSPTRTREAFESVMASFKLPKETDEEKASRTLRIQEAYEAAAAVPLQLATRSVQLMELAEDATAMGNPHAASDGYSAGTLLFAAALVRDGERPDQCRRPQGPGEGTGAGRRVRRPPGACRRPAPAGRGSVPPSPRDLSGAASAWPTLRGQ